MHYSLKALLATVVIAGTAYTVNHARAGQTYTGEGGLPLNPTASGIPLGNVEFGAKYFDFGEDKGTGHPDPSPPPLESTALPQGNPLTTYKFNFYGIHAAGRVHENFELSGGIERLRVSGDGPFDGLTKTGIALGAKYLINPDATGEDIRYAIGAGYNRALLKNIRAYGVASKPFRMRDGRAPIWAHLGLRWDRFDLDDVGGGDSKKFSVFAGTEFPLTGNGELSFIGEIQSKNHEFGGAKMPFSLGLQYAPTGGVWSVTGGWQRQGLTNDEGFYARLGFRYR